MSTKIKDSLHELIHAMTKTEKRYFKLHATRHSAEESTMVMLFDFIARQESYDEEALFHHFKGKSLLNQFSTVKKRLYDLVLQSLHLFHENNSLEAQLSRMLHQATILYEKSLYDQSLRHLRSIEKAAQRHELFLILVQAGKLKQRIVETKGYDLEDDPLKELNAATQHFLSREQLIHELWQIKSNLFRQLQSSGIVTTDEQKRQLGSLMLSLPDVPSLSVRSTEAMYLFHHIQSAYYYATGEFRKSLDSTELTIRHLLDHPAFTKERPNILISSLTNACYLAEMNGLYDKGASFLELLKDVSKDQENLSEDLQIKLFSSVSSIELSLLILRGDFQASGQLITAILSGMERYGSKIHPARRTFFQLKLAIVHMGNENHSAALRHINELINTTRPDEQEEMVITAHLLSVILHFELRNMDYLPYAIKSTQRLLKSYQRMQGFEQLFLQTFSKTVKIHELDFPELFGSLFQQLNELQQQGNLSVHFDFLTWVEAKARHHSLAAALKQKYHFLASA